MGWPDEPQFLFAAAVWLKISHFAMVRITEMGSPLRVRREISIHPNPRYSGLRKLRAVSRNPIDIQFAEQRAAWHLFPNLQIPSNRRNLPAGA
jgi:hypothetical protein